MADCQVHPLSETVLANGHESPHEDACQTPAGFLCKCNVFFTPCNPNPFNVFMRPWAGGAQPARDAPASQAPAPSQQGVAARLPPAEGRRLPARTAAATVHQLGLPTDARSTPPPLRIAGSPAGCCAASQPARGDLRAAQFDRLTKSSGMQHVLHVFAPSMRPAWLLTVSSPRHAVPINVSGTILNGG